MISFVFMNLFWYLKLMFTSAVGYLRLLLVIALGRKMATAKLLRNVQTVQLKLIRLVKM